MSGLVGARSGGRPGVGPLRSVGRRRRLDGFPTEKGLRLAVRDGAMRLVYQPIVSLHDGRIRGVEALVRWEDPEQGTLSPAAFIPLAEETGAIVELGRWVLEKACSQMVGWCAACSDPPSYVTVNVSARQIDREGLVQIVSDALESSGLAPGRLAIELTESMLMEAHDAPAATLEELRGLGIRLVLDDFGTGYSSLSYLTRFPLDGLKIDRSFVAGLDTAGAGHGRAVVAAIAGMAGALDLAVVAEGVETAEQAVAARDLGCALGQGFYFARPLPASAIRGLLVDRIALPRG